MRTEVDFESVAIHREQVEVGDWSSVAFIAKDRGVIWDVHSNRESACQLAAEFLN